MLKYKKQKKTINKYYKNFNIIFLIFIILQSLPVSLNAHGGNFRSHLFNFTNLLEGSTKLFRARPLGQQDPFVFCKEYSRSRPTVSTIQSISRRTSWLSIPILGYKGKARLCTSGKDEYIQNLSVSEINNNIPLLTNFLAYTLNKNGLNMLGNPKNVVSKVSRILSVVDTETGRKFLKVSDIEKATKEYDGGSELARYLPTIETNIIKLKNIGILIRPFIEVNENINFLGEIIARIQLYERERLPHYFFQLFDPLFEDAFIASMLTIEQSKKRALNDYLYYDKLKTWKKDKEKGRIEAYYGDQFLNLGEKTINWRDLVLKKWKINGISYEETIDELLNKSQLTLSPNNKRVLGVSHGDWHEMNILTSKIDNKYTSRYIDTELSGLNDLIGDAVVYLTYTSLFADYILPKYFPERFQDSYHFLNAFDILRKRKSNNLKINITQDTVEVDNCDTFNTDEIRKRICLRFVEKYFSRLLNSCESLYGREVSVFNEEYMQSCFLVRMLGTYNLRNFEMNDQLLIMGFIYKVLGTPINKIDRRSFLLRFFDSI